MIRAALASLLLVACSTPSERPALHAGAHATDPRPVFSTHTPPVLRFTDAPSDLEIEWRTGARSDALTFKVDVYNRAWIIRVALNRPSPEDGELVVRTATGEWRWPARYEAVDQQHPAVRALTLPTDPASRLAILDARLMTASPDARPWLHVARAQTLRRAQGPLESVDAFVAAADAARAAGAISHAAQLRQRAANQARLGQAFDRAIELLNAALADWPHPITRANDRWARGLVARDRGRLVTARTDFLGAVEALRMIGRREWAVQLDQNLEEMALATGGRWQPMPPDPGAWTEVTGRDWLDLLAMRQCAIPPHWPALIERMSRAIDRFAGGELAAPFRANFYVNRALAHEANGALEAARADARSARTLDPAGGLEPPVLRRLEARLRARDRPEAAIDMLTDLLVDLRAKGYADGRVWRALADLGDAYAAAGHPAEALRHWSDALTALERVGQTLQLDGSRSAFHAHRDHVVNAVVGALLQPGPRGGAAAFRTAEAHGAPVGRMLARVARLDGSSALAAALRTAAEQVRIAEEALTISAIIDRPAAEAGLDRATAELRAIQTHLVTEVIRDAGVASADAVLGALADDEALVLLQPIRGADCSTRWRSFWLADGRVAVGPPEAEPLTRWIAAANDRGHVYLVGGTARARHAFERAVGATVSRLPTASMLVRPAHAADGPPVVVGDPRGDLAAARMEAEWLQSRGATTLIGRAATRAAFDDATANARWLHFAGHGVSDSDDPFAAHLELADGALPLTAILAMRRPARTVILAGCETARSVPLSHLESLGLADAFLFAGARSVIAADYTVPDDDAGRFSLLFHTRDGPARPAAALAEVRAMMAVADDPAADGWHLFGLR